MISKSLSPRFRARLACCVAVSLLAPAIFSPSHAQNAIDETSEEAMIDAPPADFPSVERENAAPRPGPNANTDDETIDGDVEDPENAQVQPAPQLPSAQDILDARPTKPAARPSTPPVKPVPVASVPIVMAADAEERTLQDFLSGSLAPLALPLSEAREGWRTMRVPRPATDPRMSASGGDPIRKFMAEHMGHDPQVLFTQGRTLRLNNALHLVVYRAAFFSDSEANKYFEERMGDWRDITSEEATRLFRGLLGTVTLRASLLRAEELSGMQDISPFSFEEKFQGLSALIAQEVARQKPKPATAPTRNATTPTVVEVPPKATPVKPSAPRPSAPAASPAGEALARERLKQLHTGLLQYRQDWDGMLPSMDDSATAQKMLNPYLPSPASWIDPSTKGLFLPNPRLSKKQWSHVAPFASKLIAFYSSAPSGGRRWVLRLDGVARSITEAEWQKLRASAKIP